MVKKRKPEATRLDEVDRSMYSTFCSAANSLSQLYSQAMSHQRVSFQAGERQGLEKLYQWIARQQEEGSRVTTVDIVAYLQNELDCGAEEPPMSPAMQIQQQHLQNAMLSANLGPVGLAPKNAIFSNALSSPVRRSLGNYTNAPREFLSHHPHNSDSSLDIRDESPGHDFPS